MVQPKATGPTSWEPPHMRQHRFTAENYDACKNVHTRGQQQTIGNGTLGAEIAGNQWREHEDEVSAGSAAAAAAGPWWGRYWIPFLRKGVAALLSTSLHGCCRYSSPKKGLKRTIGMSNMFFFFSDS